MKNSIALKAECIKLEGNKFWGNRDKVLKADT